MSLTVAESAVLVVVLVVALLVVLVVALLALLCFLFEIRRWSCDAADAMEQDGPPDVGTQAWRW
ncbi:MAG: hypothetical protein M3381_09610 [Actinomycetota bacterium]|nr:hypothetical protein [Actinomycetota bacterium]